MPTPATTASRMIAHRIISLGAINAFIAVAAGAFAAHGLKHNISANNLAIFHTAADYQLAHALGLLLLGLLYKMEPVRPIKISAKLMLTGMIIFSGSLYILALSNIKWLGMITPIGGLCLLASWLIIGVSFFRKNN